MNMLTGSSEKILYLDIRRQIYEFIKKHPGSHFREIERKTGLSGSTVRYHLNFMSKHELLKENKSSNRICYYPSEFMVEDSRLMEFLKQESLRRILICLMHEKKYNQKEIGQMVNHSVSAVSWHLKRLEDAKILYSERVGKEKLYKIIIDKKDIIRLLITYRQSFFDILVDRMVEMWEQ